MESRFSQGHGVIVKLMFMRVVHELSSRQEKEIKRAVAKVSEAKTRKVRRCGISSQYK